MYLHRKFASKTLIDILHKVGFGASYAEVLRFQSAIVAHPPPVISEGAFSQFVFDNADHNTATLDGFNMLHIMGGIQCTSPASFVQRSGPIMRNKGTQLEAPRGNCIDHRIYEKKKDGVITISMKDIRSNESFPVQDAFYCSNLVWLMGKFSTNSTCFPSWNGFMETTTRFQPYEETKQMCLPFVHLPPSQYDTIFTVFVPCKRRKREIATKILRGNF